MSRRTLVLAAVSAVVVGVAIYLIAGRGGSATPPAAAGPSPAAPRAVASSTPTTTAQAGPKVAGSAAPGATEPVEGPRAQVPPEIAARALAVAGDRAPAPTGSGKVR